MSARRLHGAAALALALASSGCLSLQWRRETRGLPPAEAIFEELEPGRSDLALCLARLGAPTHVRELSGGGIALAYGAYGRRDLGFGVSVPVVDYVSASYDFTDIDRRGEGWLLVFDGDWRLTAVRRGHLRSLTAGPRSPRPAPVDLDEAGEQQDPDSADEGGRNPGNRPPEGG